MTKGSDLTYTILMVKVKDKNGNEHTLSGRLESMVLLIIENAGEIIKPQTAQVTFDCAGGKVKANIRKELELPGQAAD